MGRALKDATNPAFRSKYADLASVMDACMPALNKHGIAVLQPLVDDEHGRYVKTVFVHGESGDAVECRVPLIVGKNDMQGYGSAVTYARRYGLMSMAGIAPEDDDGNAAAKAAPAQQARLAQTQKTQQAVSSQNTASARKLADEMIAAAQKYGQQAVTGHKNYQADIAFLETTSPDDFDRVMAALNPPAIDDQIPYEGK